MRVVHGPIRWRVPIALAALLCAGVLTSCTDKAASPVREEPPPPGITAAEARARLPEPPAHLPDPLPDIVAMVKAETPVEVTVKGGDGVWQPGNGELAAVWRRDNEGDHREARRLYREFADKNAGTSDAADALFRLAGSHMRYGSSGQGGREGLQGVGELAFELAEKYGSNSLAPRALYMCARETLEGAGRWSYYVGRARYEPSEDDWRRAFQAAALLAGRYPGDPRGLECLVNLGDQIILAQGNEDLAKEIYELVRDHAGEEAGSRLRAFRGLHDYALLNGNTEEARDIAVQAMMSCAGSLGQWDEQEIGRIRPEVYAGSFWEWQWKRGLPSEGPVLLTKPAWPECTAIRLEETSREICHDAAGAWEPMRRETSREPEPIKVHLLQSTRVGMTVAVATSSVEGRVRPFSPESSLEIDLLGAPIDVSPAPESPLFVPKFPVHEGVEIYPREGLGLVRQEASREGDRVVVSICAGAHKTWRQVWNPGSSWWESAECQCLPDEPFSMCPGPYSSEPGPRYGTARVRFTATAGTRFPAKARALATEALSSCQFRNTSLYEHLTPLLPEFFSGAKLKEMEERWYQASASNHSRHPEQREEALAAAKAHMEKGENAKALEALDRHHYWPGYNTEVWHLRTELLLALDRPQEALSHVGWIPRHGAFATPEAWLFKAKAHEASEEPLPALESAQHILTAFPGTPQAEEAEHIAKRLAKHSDSLAKERRADSCGTFVLRRLWAPPVREYSPTYWAAPCLGGIGLDRLDGLPCIGLSGDCEWRWRITMDGEEREVPSGYEPEQRPAKDNPWRSWRHEFACREGVHYAAEADRLVAEDDNGEEVWRLAIPTERTGLPRLVRPHLSVEDYIVCGVGHHDVHIGMGMHHSRMSGGLLKVDLTGKLVLQTNLGYCETLVPLSPATSVGLFMAPTDEPHLCDSEQEWSVAAVNEADLSLLWRKRIKPETGRYGSGRFGGTLHVARGSSGETRIAASYAGTTIFEELGRRIRHIRNTKVLAATDLDGDGADDFIAVRHREDSDYDGRLLILDFDGNTLWEGPNGTWHAFVVADLDGDGWKEIAALWCVRQVYTLAIFGRLPEGE